MSPIESCGKQQIKINYLSENRESAQIPIEQHRHFRWQHTKLGNNLWLILNWLQAKFEAKIVEN